MISDVGSTTDFFMKPEVKKSVRTETSQAEETASQMKPSSISSSAPQKKAPPKSEFAHKLKTIAKEKEIQEQPDSDRFSKNTSGSKVEAPIQKRAPASEKKNSEIETFSDTEAQPVSMKNRIARQNPNQAPVQQQPNEEDADSVSNDDSSIKSDANIRLLSVLANPQFDVKDLSPGELKEVKEVLRDQQAQVKQASVQEFMTQLQNQFGITPDKVVQAFAKMDEKALTAPPSETVSQFVNNLNVKGAARNQVADLYKQMLSETGEAALNEKLLGSDDDSKSVSLKVMDTTQAKLIQLNKSLDSLNDSFFRNGAFQPQNNQQIPSSIRDQLKKLTESGQQEEEDTKSPNSLGALLAQLDNKAGALAAATGGAAAAATETGGASMTAATAQAPVMDMSAFAKPTSNQSQNFDQGEGSQDTARGTKAYSAQANAASAAGGTGKNFAEVSKLNVKSEGAQAKAMSTTSTAGTVTNQTPAVAGAVAAGTTAAALSPEKMMISGPNKEDSAENVQELIKQAQVIIKKGGGEMNVEMKPEGMGQVHLRVALDNGQVSIQMMAQNDKVKKLLEDGIHELKSNLASHKLQVESLKIGIANGFQDKKMEQQQGEAQREAMRDAQKEMASNFASDMRDQRQDRNSGFTDVPGWRAYKTDTKRMSVEASPEEASSFRKRDDNRRLSLIA